MQRINEEKRVVCLRSLGHPSILPKNRLQRSFLTCGVRINVWSRLGQRKVIFVLDLILLALGEELMHTRTSGANKKNKKNKVS